MIVRLAAPGPPYVFVIGRSSLATVVRELEREYGGPVRDRYRAGIETTARMRSAALPRAREATGAGR
ncbi:MAG: hypothetical protein GEV11_27610 [Streptosporangiales bacterium]|nr:hypothetical protein [Streptosporangiales bacterium]